MIGRATHTYSRRVATSTSTYNPTPISILQTNLKVNIGNYASTCSVYQICLASWGSGQLLKDLDFANPGFEGSKSRAIFQCGSRRYLGGAITSYLFESIVHVRSGSCPDPQRQSDASHLPE